MFVSMWRVPRSGESVKVWVGRSILFIAVVHTVFGLIAFRDVAGPIVRDGVFNTVQLDVSSHRNIGFWFFVSGGLLFVVGGLVAQSERLDRRFPAFLPWSLLVFAVVGSVLMPVSAFWLLFLPAGGAFLQRRAVRVPREGREE